MEDYDRGVLEFLLNDHKGSPGAAARVRQTYKSDAFSEPRSFAITGKGSVQSSDQSKLENIEGTSNESLMHGLLDIISDRNVRKKPSKRGPKGIAKSVDCKPAVRRQKSEELGETSYKLKHESSIGRRKAKKNDSKSAELSVKFRKRSRSGRGRLEGTGEGDSENGVSGSKNMV